MGGIRVGALGKCYKRYSSNGGRVTEWLTAGRACRHEERWVLRDVEFEVGPGQALAVVGRNGAGKTTLLRLINQTLCPSAGSIEVDGRIAALELGLRFHDDLSGRENLMIAGQLLGHTSAAIEHCLPQIEAFSELGEVLNQPLRTYSSGMRLRLAFSIATAIRPDVLLVDEALAVGDVRFQQKCLGRIREFLAQGTCLVLVSHDLNAIRAFCNSAILLEEGVLLRRGSPAAVLDYYNALMGRLDEESAIEQDVDASGRAAVTRSGEGQAVIESISFGAEGSEAPAFGVGDEIVLRVRGRATEEISDLTVGIALRDRLGLDVFGTNSHHLLERPLQLAAGEAFCAEFRFAANLGPGEYTVTAALHAGRTHVEGSYDWWDHAISFRVRPGEEPYFEGTVYLPTELRFESSRSTAMDAAETAAPLDLGASE